MPFFTTLDSGRLCREIGDARSHVILAAPGVTGKVAQALIDAAGRLPALHVGVVLDVSAQVAHLGYGEFAAVERLRAASIDVRHHPGLRLGVLICDDHGWSFASPARLVETDPTVDIDAFNAIALTTAQVLALRNELPPVGRQETKSPAPVVGEHTVPQATMQEVATALQVAPPQQFDLARQTQVYTSIIQFVELELEGFNLPAHTVQLPASLPLLATNDENLKSRITAHFRVFGKQAPPKELAEIKTALEALRKKHLKPVGKAGRIIFKSELPKFKQKLELIGEELKKCQETLTKDLQKVIDGVVDSISPELGQALFASKPLPLSLRMRSTEPTLEDAVAQANDELRACFPLAAQLVQAMRIHIYYKDVTYATLQDESFCESLKALLPEDMKHHALFAEITAAKASETKAGE